MPRFVKNDGSRSQTASPYLLLYRPIFFKTIVIYVKIEEPVVPKISLQDAYIFKYPDVPLFSQPCSPFLITIL